MSSKYYEDYHKELGPSKKPNKPSKLEWLLVIILAPIIYLVIVPIMVIAIMLCCDWVGEDPRE